ncbi:MAG TPA: hypothetical protein VMG12_22435 [Polyangiaceae bacterium]|nr:hypothetical protein [Polyangiaceae bacterium]
MSVKAQAEGRDVGAQRGRLAALGMTLAAVVACRAAAESEPELEATPLGELTPTQMQTLCDDVRAEIAAAGCLQEPNELALQSTTPCDVIQAISCDATAGQLQACAAASASTACEDTLDTAAACAPLVQRGCVKNLQLDAIDCPELAQIAAPFEGIYEIVGHTENDSACDTEGKPVSLADTQRFFAILTYVWYGVPVGALEGCSDIEHCRAIASAMRLYSRRPVLSGAADPEISEALYCHSADDAALFARWLSFGASADSTACQYEARPGTITRAADGNLRLDRQTSQWQKPTASDGTCPYSREDETPPEGATCTRREVTEARFVSAL